MAPNDDLKAHATSSFDFYDLLSLSTDFTQRELDRARRLTSFKYHPDKVGDDAAAREKLHMTNIGYEILNDFQLRSLHDNARNARERKKASEAHLEAGRRKLKEDLEAREHAGMEASGFASGLGKAINETDQKVRWLAADGKRRRLGLRSQRERDHEEGTSVANKSNGSAQTYDLPKSHMPQEDVPELDRSVLVMFTIAAATPPPVSASLKIAFEQFGRIESVFYVRSKRSKHSGSEEDTIKHKAYVVYWEQRAAAAAIRGWTARKREAFDDDVVWRPIDKVSWAGGEEPEGLNGIKLSQDPESKVDTLSTQPVSFSFSQNPFSQLDLEAKALRCLTEAAARQQIMTV